MPAVIPPASDLTPAAPPAIIPVGGAPDPGDAPVLVPAPGVLTPGNAPSIEPTTPPLMPGGGAVLVPTTPPAVPGTPPSNLPETPVTPPAGFLPSTKADTNANNVAPFAASWRIAIGAETLGAAAAAQAFARQRGNHTGTQLAATISDFGTAVSGLAVGLTGNQTVSGVKTFASPPRSTGNPTTDNDILNRKQVDIRSMPFLRPLDAFQIRRREDFFFSGSLTSGAIGEWGWSSTIGAGGSIAYGGDLPFATGRSLQLTTAATLNNSVSVAKAAGSAVEKSAALTCYLTTDFPANTQSAITNASVWVGWANGGSGHVLVGWDRSVGANFLIRMKGDLDGAETLINTGVALPTGMTFWPPQMAITIIGDQFNNLVLGGTSNKFRFIIASNTTANVLSKLYDAEVTAVNAVYGAGPYAGVTTRAATSKLLSVNGFEIFHGSGMSASQH